MSEDIKGPPPKFKKSKAKAKPKLSQEGDEAETGGAGGRPTKYDPEKHPELAYKFSLLGATLEEIAENLDIALSTLHLWKADHPEFSDAIWKGSKYADAHIASRLYQRAEGYVCTVEQAFKLKKGKDNEVVETVTLKQEVPPDTKAATLWLSNRDRNRWKDKQVVEVEGQDKLIEAIREGRERLNRELARKEAQEMASKLKESQSKAEAKPKQKVNDADTSN